MIISELYTILNSITKDLHSRIYSCGVFSSALAIKELCEKVLKCLYTDEFFDNLSYTPLLIELTEGKEINNDEVFEIGNFVKFLTSGKSKQHNLLQINLKGLLINAPKSNTLIEGEQEAINFSTTTPNSIYLYIAGLKLILIHDGRINYIWENIAATKAIKTIEQRLPSSQFKRLISKHYDQCLDGERETSYWQRKSDWILKSSPEIIFQKSLASYLNNYIVDGRVLEECLNANTTNRTDITIITYELKSYIIEVKWIGKSVGSSYDNKQAQDRSNSGIKQLEIYLKKDHTAICGHLVVYDARRRKDKINWNDVDKWDFRIDKAPSMVKLSANSASTKAKK